MDSVTPFNDSMRNSFLEDPFHFSSDLKHFDMYTELFNSPSVVDQMLPSDGMPSFPSTSYPSYDAGSFAEQDSAPLLDKINAAGTSYNGVDNVVLQQTNSIFVYPSDSIDADDLGAKHSNGAVPQNCSPNTSNCIIYQSVGPSLVERMLRALSLFKESSEGCILAQVWDPVRNGDQCILTTSEQPYLLDQMLAGFREVSRAFTISSELKHAFPQDLPGRVFISKLPEWTSVIYYSKAEYLRAKHAANHEVQGSFALPIFEPDEMHCCAVLELVSLKMKPVFDSGMENVCRALEAVNLRSTTPPPRLLPQCFSKEKRAVL